jgi:hypothetical protein
MISSELEEGAGLTGESYFFSTICSLFSSFFLVGLGT